MNWAPLYCLIHDKLTTEQLENANGDLEIDPTKEQYKEFVEDIKKAFYNLPEEAQVRWKLQKGLKDAYQVNIPPPKLVETIQSDYPATPEPGSAYLKPPV